MQVSPEIMEIAEKIKSTVDCEKIYLFGSYAYGTPNEDSDYDFYVIIPDNTIKPLEAMKQISRELAKTEIVTPVDILASYASNFKERSIQPTLERIIAREGVVLYEQNGLNMQMV
ncbi:MAG TPA: nucleotidyltransferase domain-containing protein [Clostridiales bacterium]|nr:nucleotidyltransferase domain-containing protein [Clostridiales bacterium]